MGGTHHADDDGGITQHTGGVVCGGAVGREGRVDVTKQSEGDAAAFFDPCVGVFGGGHVVKHFAEVPVGGSGAVRGEVSTSSSGA